MLDGLPTGDVMAGEGEAAGLAIHAEDGDVVAALVAAVEEPAGRVEGEAARIVPARPFLADERQARRRGRRRRSRCCRAAGCRRRRTARRRRPGSRSRSCCRRTRAAGWRSSAARSSAPSRRRSRTARWSSLPPGWSRTSGRWGGNGNAAARRRAAARPTADRSGSARRFCSSNFQTKILSRPRSTCSTKRPEGSAWIMWAWVRSWPLKAKLPGGAWVALVGPILPASTLTSDGVAQPAVGQDRQHRHRAAEVVGHQQVTSGRMDADVGRAGAAGADGVEQLQLPSARLTAKALTVPSLSSPTRSVSLAE